jgi:UDP-N-acetylmuramoylalanine--D-glutamate ligase
VLITGGTDKNLDFAPLRPLLTRPAAVCLLEGTALPKFQRELQDQNLSFLGPYGSLRAAFEEAVRTAEVLRDKSGQEPVVLLSPGCASFGMFLNEFDRGRQFVDLVKGL